MSNCEHNCIKKLFQHANKACCFIGLFSTCELKCLRDRLTQNLYYKNTITRRILIFPAFSRLFLPHVGLSRSCVRSGLFSLSCDGFRALLEIFRICMFTKTTTVVSRASAHPRARVHPPILTVLWLGRSSV